MITALSFGIIALAVILLAVLRKQAKDAEYINAIAGQLMIVMYKIEKLGGGETGFETIAEAKKFTTWVDAKEQDMRRKL